MRPRLLSLGLMLLACGCTGPGPRSVADGPATREQLLGAYPDLASGRYQVLADFNTEEQLERANVIGELAPVRLGSGRSATGGRALTGTLPPRGRLQIDASGEWSSYSLLLLSLRLNEPATVRFSVQDPTNEWVARRDLQPGWNLVRFDVAEIGMRIDLAEVFALVIQSETALPFALDDVLLADAGETLHQTIAAEQLSTEVRGLRVQVTGDDLAVTFQSGVIISWQAGRADPLGGTTALGPWPVLVDPGWDQGPGPARSPALRGAQRVLESSGFRTVLAADVPGGTRRWTVYPHGVAYAGYDLADPGEQRISYLIGLPGQLGFEAAPAPPQRPDDEQLGYAVVHGGEPDPATLLWCPAMPGEARKLRRTFGPADAELFVQLGDQARQGSAQMLSVQAGDPDADALRERCLAYQYPAEIQVSNGRRVRDTDGDLDGDGFNETEGCYELGLKERLLRIRVRADQRTLETPVFRVHGSAGLRCWVYVNGRILTNLGRDAQGNLLFAVPGTQENVLSIEVSAVAPAGEGSG